MNRAEFSRALTVEARDRSAHLFVSVGETRQPIASVWRAGGRLTLATRGRGITLHRRGGVSFSGIPRSGGTSILWGTVKERVDRLGRDNRALRLGPIGIYIGSDF